MIHPDTALKFISDKKGNGVVATKLIPKGTITWIQDPIDQKFTKEEMSGMAPFFRELLQIYCFRDNMGNFVLCWDNGRFINHSSDSNCITTAYNFELAIRDIQAGEELTDDYGYLNLTEPLFCAPEPGIARNIVLPDDLLRCYPEWDKKLKAAFKQFNKVPQPFKEFIDKKYAEKVKLVAAGKAEMDSILNCYYADKNEVWRYHGKHV
jgi:hypothetical protein